MGAAAKIAMADVHDRIPAVDPDRFKQAMRRMASGVAVVTTNYNGHRWGFTATAVCSLSAEPPCLIVCVNRSADAHDNITASGSLCVNLLHSGQDGLASRFSGGEGHKGEERFVGASWHSAMTGSPILDGCVAAFDCRVVGEQTFATHTIFICEVVGVEAQNETPPLLYYDRKFTAPEA